MEPIVCQCGEALTEERNCCSTCGDALLWFAGNPIAHREYAPQKLIISYATWMRFSAACKAAGKDPNSYSFFDWMEGKLK